VPKPPVENKQVSGLARDYSFIGVPRVRLREGGGHRAWAPMGAGNNARSPVEGSEIIDHPERRDGSRRIPYSPRNTVDMKPLLPEARQGIAPVKIANKERPLENLVSGASHNCNSFELPPGLEPRRFGGQPYVLCSVTLLCGARECEFEKLKPPRLKYA
jgi:hypothetical protein